MTFHGTPWMTLSNAVDRKKYGADRKIARGGILYKNRDKRRWTPEQRAAYDAVVKFNKEHGIKVGSRHRPNNSIPGLDRRLLRVGHSNDKPVSLPKINMPLIED